MRAGPVRRLMATVGLVALAPIGFLLVRDELTLPAAGLRAGITLAVVLVVARLAAWGLDAMAGDIESWDGSERRRPRPAAVPDGGPTGDTPAH